MEQVMPPEGKFCSPNKSKTWVGIKKKQLLK